MPSRLAVVTGVCLHQPHRAARGAGEVASEPDGEAAAAPHADHLRHQLPLPAGVGNVWEGSVERCFGRWMQGEDMFFQQREGVMAVPTVVFVAGDSRT